MNDIEFTKKKLALLQGIFTILYPKFKKYLSKNEVVILDRYFSELEKL